MLVPTSDNANTVFLLLGANLGDRLKSFRKATELIEERVGRIILVSSIFETEPWGVLEQPTFLNQVLQIESQLGPTEVLHAILDIEHELGRVRHERWGARLIDIDILYYNNLIEDSSRLTIPHPRLHERRFTLAPLAEIAPEFCHPVLKQNNAQLLLICADDSSVKVLS